MHQRTIFACSTGSGRTAIAVWRVSGPKAYDIISTLAGPNIVPRRATWRVLNDPGGLPIDDGIVLFFEGPNSATGEDIAEFHVHGSESVRLKMISVLTDFGLSPAKPGEFTSRAFENGRMDLLGVEALGDLLNSETEGQRQQALAIGQGAAADQLRLWRDGLVAALAVLEAAVDFPDEEGVPRETSERAGPLLRVVHDEMASVLAAGDGRKVREGLELAIIGAPNAGKSSLLNRLLNEDRAIVSDQAGTTRDAVSERLSLGGRLVRVIDTAGLRDKTSDEIERAGIERTKEIAARADIVIWLRDVTDRTAVLAVDVAGEVLTVDNKIDLGSAKSSDGLALSLKTGQGWDAFITRLEEAAQRSAPVSLFPHERQQLLIKTGRDAVAFGLQNIDLGHPPELAAEDIRHALLALDQLDGRRTTEAVLGQIFSSFCIGK